MANNWTIKILDSIDQIKKVEDLQKVVWPGSDTDVVPAHLLITAVHNGGFLLGAFHAEGLEPPLVGFANRSLAVEHVIDFGSTLVVMFAGSINSNSVGPRGHFAIFAADQAIPPSMSASLARRLSLMSNPCLTLRCHAVSQSSPCRSQLWRHYVTR